MENRTHQRLAAELPPHPGPLRPHPHSLSGILPLRLSPHHLEAFMQLALDNSRCTDPITPQYGLSIRSSPPVRYLGTSFSEKGFTQCFYLVFESWPWPR